MFSCVRLLISAVLGTIGVIMGDSEYKYIFAALYQPILIIIVFCLFSVRIDALISCYFDGKSFFIEVILLSVVLMIVVLFLNSLIEFFYRMIFKNGDFQSFFEIQQHAHNYFMTVISLIAIYSFLGSVIIIASGNLFIFLIPQK